MFGFEQVVHCREILVGTANPRLYDDVLIHVVSFVDAKIRKKNEIAIN